MGMNETHDYNKGYYEGYNKGKELVQENKMIMKVYNISYRIVSINYYGRFSFRRTAATETQEDYAKFIEVIEDHILNSVKHSFDRQDIWISSITLL